MNVQYVCRYLSIKAALLEPSTLEHQTGLVAATSSWLGKITYQSLLHAKRAPPPDNQNCNPSRVNEAMERW